MGTTRRKKAVIFIFYDMLKKKGVIDASEENTALSLSCG